LLDLAPWLDPLDGENPSGVSLRDHPSFHEIERLMEARVEITRDERNKPVSEVRIPVDWGAVLAKSEELRRHGRDLRLLVIVTRAHANERGLAGLADGLTLIARTLESHWDTLHPELRPAPNPRDGAVRRINALLQLEAGRDGLLGDLRERAMFSARGLGAVTGLDLERGTLDARAVLADLSGISDETRAEETARQEQLILRVRAACAALTDQAPEEMAALTEGARAAVAAAEAVEAVLGERLGGAPALPELKRFLGRVLATLDRPAAAAAEASAPEAAMTEARPAPPAAAGGAAIPGRLASREEVIACLDRIIDFYDRTEPASPVPFLARRMRRMVPMDFLALMEDLAPSGLKEFRSLAGLSDDKKAGPRPQGEKT
jgi:type VI secretion system protein ImpA